MKELNKEPTEKYINKKNKKKPKIKIIICVVLHEST